MGRRPLVFFGHFGVLVVLQAVWECQQMIEISGRYQDGIETIYRIRAMSGTISDKGLIDN